MESKYDYVVFDIETTGLHPDSDQICEIAAIGVKDGLPQGTFSTLVAIEGSMPEAAGRVNGITDDMLKGAPAIGDALDAFLDFIGEDAVLAGPPSARTRPWIWPSPWARASCPSSPTA